MSYESIPQGGETNIELSRGFLYEALLNILGATGSIMPLGDPKHQATTSTLKLIGNRQDIFTLEQTDTWAGMTLGVKGIVPFMTLNGTSHGLTSPDAGFWTDPGALTYGVWIRPAVIANNIIWAKWDETTAAELREFKLYLDGNGDAGFQIYDETNNAGIGRKIDTALTVNEWLLLLATHTGGADATNIIVYKNDAAADDANIVDDAGFANPVDTATIVSLGFEEDSAGAKVNFFDGDIALPFFSSEELSADSALRMYELGRRALAL